MFIRKNKFYFLLFVICVALVTIWFRGLSLIGGAESGLPFYNPYNEIKYGNFPFFEWIDKYLGAQTGRPMVIRPFYAFIYLMEGIGFSSVFVQAVFFLFILTSAAFGMYVLTRKYFYNPKIAFIASVFYLINPISTAIVWARMQYPFMFFYAFLPFGLYLFSEAQDKKSFRYIIYLNFIALLFAPAFLPISTIFNFWFLITILLLYKILIDSKNKREIFKQLFIYLSFFVIWLAFNIWWLAGIIYAIFSNPYITEVAVTERGSLDAAIALSNMLGKLYFVFPMLHERFFTVGTWQNIYSNALSRMVVYTVPIVVFASVLKKEKPKYFWYFLLISVLGLFFIKGLSGPLGEVLYLTYKNVRPFAVFRNPFEKFSFMVPLTFAPLAAFSIYNFYIFLSKKINKSPSMFVVSIIITFILIVNFPLLLGLVFTQALNVKDEQKLNYETRVPIYYEELRNYFKDKKGLFRLLVMPLGGEGVVYQWGEKSYRGVELSNELIGLPSASLCMGVPFLCEVTKSMTSLVNYESELLPKAMSLINSNYLLIRSDIDYKKGHMQKPAVVKEKIDIVNKLSLVDDKNFYPLSLYRLLDKDTLPRIFATRDLVQVYPEVVLDDLMLVMIPEIRNISFIQHEEVQDLASEVIIKQKQSFVYVKPLELSTIDSLSRLTHVSHLPTDTIYPLVRIKEALESPSYLDTSKIKEHNTTLLAKRAVEIFRLAEAGVSYKAEDIIEDYLVLLNELWPRDGDIKRVLIGQLILQLTLFEEADNAYNFKLDNLVDEINYRLEKSGVKLLFPLPEEDSDDLSGNLYVYRFDVPDRSNFSLRFKNGDNEDYFEKYFEGRDFYVDGERQEGIVIGSGWELELKQGVHEIALVMPKSKNLTSETDFTIHSGERLDIPIGNSTYTGNYKVSFDYWIKRGGKFNVKIIQEDEFLLEKQFAADPYDHGFKNYTGEFRARLIEGEPIIVFKAIPSDGCLHARFPIFDKCRNLEYSKLFDIPTEVEISNLKVEKIFSPNAYLQQLSDNFSFLSDEVPEVSFYRENPTLYRVKVNNTNGKYLLVLSETFHTGWQAYIKENIESNNWIDRQIVDKYLNERFIELYSGSIKHAPFLTRGLEKISDKSHLLVNGYANGWLIDKPGKYEIIIEFAGQKYLYLGLVTSLVSITGTFFYLVIRKLKS